MKFLARYAFLSGIAIFVLSSCGSGSAPEESLASLATNLFVSEDAFLSIQDGASFETVTNVLKSAMRHEFTTAESGGIYSLISCFVNVGEGVDFWLLFRGKVLVKVIWPVAPTLEYYSWQGTPATRIKSWSIEDKAYIERTIGAPALTHAEIQKLLNDLKRNPRAANETSNVAPAFLLTHYVEKMGPKMRKDFETNKELLKRFDGCRVDIGMDREEIGKLYGTPLRIFSTKNQGTVTIFGDSQDLSINPLYSYSCLAVVFEKGGRVTDVYSHEFFNDEWKK